jgi:hypothetical protein
MFRRARSNVLWAAVQGSVLGGIILFLLANNFQAYRFELAFLPAMALGAAHLLGALTQHTRLQERRLTP